MGFMDFIKELAGEDQSRDNSMVNVNDRGSFLNRPGALHICVNKESMKVTSVRLCDLYSQAKEDTFEAFIKEQVKQVKKLDFIPNEAIFSYYVPDLATCPRVFKEENDHFIPYIQQMQPQMRIDLTDAVFAVKYGFDLIDNGRCFSGFSGKVGRSEKYKAFIEGNEKEKQKTIVNYYLDNIEEEYKKNRGISARNPLNNMLHRLGENEAFVEMAVRSIEKRKKIAPLLMDMFFPVLYNTPWGQKHISNSEMLNYVAKYNMKYLGAEFKNKQMLEFFRRNGLFDYLDKWDDAVVAMDDYVLHRGPGISDDIKPIPGLTTSETLYRNILNKGSEIGRQCYLRLCTQIREQLAINPMADVSAMYPDFIRPDCAGVRPMPPDPVDYGVATGTVLQEAMEKELREQRKNNFFHF